GVHRRVGPFHPVQHQHHHLQLPGQLQGRPGGDQQRLQLVLQRRLACSTSQPPAPVGGAPLAMADGGPPVAFPAPPGPLEDLGGVPHAHFQKVMQQGAHFRHTHLFLFFPPTAASAAPGTPTPAWIAPCGDASPPSPGFHTRPIRIPPWPTGCPPRSSTSSPAPPPTSPAAPRPGRWSDDTSAPAPGWWNAAPAAARS